MPGLILGVVANTPPPGGGGDGLLLDGLSNVACAYSTRKLRTAYSGSAIRVRRSSDSAEQDIGFSGNELDTVSLASFVGANNGLVTTWYDQSGNGVNATQSTPGDQPPLVVLARTIRSTASRPCGGRAATNGSLFPRRRPSRCRFTWSPGSTPMWPARTFSMVLASARACCSVTAGQPITRCTMAEARPMAEPEHHNSTLSCWGVQQCVVVPVHRWWLQRHKRKHRYTGPWGRSSGPVTFPLVLTAGYRNSSASMTPSAARTRQPAGPPHNPIGARPDARPRADHSQRLRDTGGDPVPVVILPAQPVVREGVGREDLGRRTVTLTTLVP